MQVKCVVPCTNFGIPTFYATVVEVTQEEYDDGRHYDKAIAAAMEADREQISHIVFDEYDGPKWLFDHFWPNANACS